jgi:hypothetical protein
MIGSLDRLWPSALPDGDASETGVRASSELFLEVIYAA